MEATTSDVHTHRDPLTRDEVDHLARTEMPELTAHLRSLTSVIARLQQLNANDPQCDLNGLHEMVDQHLAPLTLRTPEHPAVGFFAEFVELYPDMRPPLLTKTVLISLLA